jgi:hypothetical protein
MFKYFYNAVKNNYYIVQGSKSSDSIGIHPLTGKRLVGLTKREAKDLTQILNDVLSQY